jgi:hydroxymethylbilane synthase
MNKKIVRVGSRDSVLALLQAQQVITSIKEKSPNVDCELITFKTTGDLILDRNLAEIGGKGLFVKELDRALLNNEIDISVSSLKDLPTIISEELPIVAYTERENPMDVLVLPKDRTTFDLTLPIGTSSERRSLQLKILYGDTLQVIPFRGNMQTRLNKLETGQYGAGVAAYAALSRLSLEGRIFKTFNLDEMIPSAGQGIIAVQARAEEDTTFLPNVETSEACATAERAFIEACNGDCTSPLAALAQISGDELTLSALYSENGGYYKSGKLTGPTSDAASIGYRLSEKLRLESINER